MRCEHIRELLSPYLDKMTNEKENAAVEAHLEVCSQCREEFEHLQKVCSMLRNLEEPKLPEGFSEDLRKKLLHERVKIFGNRDIKTPRRPGWIAASVAGIALFLGIYASSYLPVNSVIASIQKWMVTDTQKPTTIAIEDIIKRAKIQLELNENNDTNNENQPAEIAQQDPTNNSNIIVGNDNNTNNTSSDNEPVKVAAKADPKEVNILTTKVRVEDVESSIRDVITIAEANSGEYLLPANDRSTLQAFATSNVKIVSIKVDEDKVDKVLENLRPIGRIGSPVSDKVVLTQEYQDALDNITSLENLATAIEKQDAITEADQTRLNEIRKNITKWENTKATIDREIKKVTLEVYLIQDINP